MPLRPARWEVQPWAIANTATHDAPRLRKTKQKIEKLTTWPSLRAYTAPGKYPD
jgi:hypothetical protein